MKLKSVVFLLAYLIMITGCEDYISNEKKTGALYDANLIKAIQGAADKQDIYTEDLLPASLTVLEQEYYDSYVEDAKIAPRLGYEVGLRKGKGAYIGDVGKAYFNLNGRELRKDKDSGRDGRGGRDGKECFSLILPVTFIMSDGSEITVENKEDWRKIKNWYEAHPDSKERPLLLFPVEVVLNDGTTITINEEEEIRRLHEYCKENRDDGDKGRGKCFELVYPVTFVLPDRSTMIIERREDMGQLRTWYADHPDTRERPSLQYPVNIVLEDGTTITVNNHEDMRRLREECEGRKGGDRGREKCFEFVYPVTYTMPDGSSITIENREEMRQLRSWYSDHPDYRERPSLQFPVEVTFEDGTTVTINNHEEMRGVIARCDEGRGGGNRP